MRIKQSKTVVQITLTPKQFSTLIYLVQIGCDDYQEKSDRYFKEVRRFQEKFDAARNNS